MSMSEPKQEQAHRQAPAQERSHLDGLAFTLWSWTHLFSQSDGPRHLPRPETPPQNRNSNRKAHRVIPQPTYRNWFPPETRNRQQIHRNWLPQENRNRKKMPRPNWGAQDWKAEEDHAHRPDETTAWGQPDTTGMREPADLPRRTNWTSRRDEDAGRTGSTNYRDNLAPAMGALVTDPCNQTGPPAKKISGWCRGDLEAQTKGARGFLMRVARSYATSWETGIRPEGLPEAERSARGRAELQFRWDGQGPIWESWTLSGGDEILNQLRSGNTAYPELWTGIKLANACMGIWIWVTTGKTTGRDKPTTCGRLLGAKCLDTDHPSHYCRSPTVHVVALGMDPAVLVFDPRATWGSSTGSARTNWHPGTSHWEIRPGSEKAERALFLYKSYIANRWGLPLSDSNWSTCDRKRSHGKYWHKDLLEEQRVRAAEQAQKEENDRKIREEEAARRQAEYDSRPPPAPPAGEPPLGSWAPPPPPPPPGRATGRRGTGESANTGNPGSPTGARTGSPPGAATGKPIRKSGCYRN